MGKMVVILTPSIATANYFDVMVFIDLKGIEGLKS
jgi:hypothetical protein